MSVIIEELTLPKHNPKEIDKNVLIGYAIVKEDNTAELCLEGVHYLIKMLPTPHGRLIDADALENQVAEWRNCLKFQDAQILCTVIDMIHKAPTVIKAEVGD